MCQSIAEGGARCSSHACDTAQATRDAYINQYGPDAPPLDPLTAADPRMVSDPSEPHPLVSDGEDEYWTSGDKSLDFAVQLHEATGYPIVLVSDDPHEGVAGWVMAGVRTPSGTILDVRGEHDATHWGAHWGEYLSSYGEDYNDEHELDSETGYCGDGDGIYDATDFPPGHLNLENRDRTPSPIVTRILTATGHQPAPAPPRPARTYDTLTSAATQQGYGPLLHALPTSRTEVQNAGGNTMVLVVKDTHQPGHVHVIQKDGPTYWVNHHDTDTWDNDPISTHEFTAEADVVAHVRNT